MLKGHTGTVRCVAFSPDGASLLTASDDKTAKVRRQRQRGEPGAVLHVGSWRVTCRDRLHVVEVWRVLALPPAAALVQLRAAARASSSQQSSCPPPRSRRNHRLCPLRCARRPPPALLLPPRVPAAVVAAGAALHAHASGAQQLAAQRRAQPRRTPGSHGRRRLQCQGAALRARMQVALRGLPALKQSLPSAATFNMQAATT